MTSYRSSSLRHFSFNRHSERGQECFVGKTGNRIVPLSEESITLVTSYRPSIIMMPYRIPSFWTVARMPCRKTGNKTMNRSEESITRMTSYRLPHYGSSPSHSLRITINVLRHYDTFRFPHYAADPLLLFRMTPNGNHMLRLLTYS